MPVSGKVVSTAHQGEARRARQADRYAARHVLWRESTLARVRSCGAVGVMPAGAVAVKASGTCADGSRRGGFGGLAHCGSTWACPVCSARIATHRALELSGAVQAWHHLGGRVAMVTLTQRHDRGQSLAELWGSNGYAWAAVTSGGAWKADQAAYGVHGWVRVVEVTHGANGWHVHVHALVFLTAHGGWSGSDDQAEYLGASMFQRWRAALIRKGMAAPLASHGGLDVRLVGVGDAVNVGDYFTKTTYRPERNDVDGVGFEVAAGGQKSARMGNRTPFGILADLVSLGETSDLALWYEWEAGSHGRRQMTWSKDLRAELVAGPDVTDAEVVEADQGGAVLLLLGAESWRSVCARHLDGVLLGLVELDDDGQALVNFLSCQGFPWEDPPPL